MSQGNDQTHEDEVLGKAYDRRLMARLWVYVRPHWRWLAVSSAIFPVATLVELAARQNYIPEGGRAEYGRSLLKEYRRYLGENVPEERAGLRITILGAGCQACEQLARNVRAALTQMDVPAEVEQVSGVKKIAEYNVIGTPALLVNGKVRSVGRPLSVAQIVKLLSDAKKA